MSCDAFSACLLQIFSVDVTRVSWTSIPYDWVATVKVDPPGASATATGVTLALLLPKPTSQQQSGATSIAYTAMANGIFTTPVYCCVAFFSRLLTF
jgi:hypothetical protein